MLAGKREPIRTYTTHTKDFPVVVESSKGGIEGIERILRKDVSTCDVAEVEECVDRLDNIHMYITFKGVHEDLAGLSMLR